MAQPPSIVALNQEPFTQNVIPGNQISPNPIADLNPVPMSGANIIQNLAEPVNIIPTITVAAQKQIIQDWFDQLEHDLRPEASAPLDQYIDVQPDTRSILMFIVHNCITKYDSLDRESQETFSLFNFIAYELLMFYAFVLTVDINFRKPNSCHANEYKTNALKCEYYNKLRNSQISEELADVLMNFAPMRDPSKPFLTFIPSFSATLFTHDYGRLIPPQVFIILHNLYAQQRKEISKSEFTRQFYNARALNLDDHDVPISNILGGTFKHEDRPVIPDTWLTHRMKSLIDPFITRALHLRPSYQPIEIHTLDKSLIDFNPYDYLLNYSDKHTHIMTNFISRMDTFYRKNPGIKTVTLSELILKCKGVAIVSHTIEPATLPTWHTLKTYDRAIEPSTPVKLYSPPDYAELCNFLAPPPTHEPSMIEKEAAACTACKLPKELLLMQKHKHNPDERPYEFKIFEAVRDCTPDVYLYQPYESHADRANVTITLGIKIETEEFDAIGIPLVNFRDSVAENNATTKIGSIFQHQIQDIDMNSDPNHYIRILQRHSNTTNTRAYAIRNAGRVIIPHYCSENITKPHGTKWLPGHTREEHHDDAEYAYTWTSRRHQVENELSTRPVYLWSSYRYMDYPSHNPSMIHMYHTLAGLYGTKVPLVRIPNPATLYPRI